MGEGEAIRGRKLEHLLVSLTEDVEHGDPFFDEVYLVHEALPELDFRDVTLESTFLGRRIGAPLVISGMTGGHIFAGEINALLAEVAEAKRLPIGVGSQRAAIVDPTVAWTYRVVREIARSVPVIGNIGAQQLLSDDFLSVAERAVEIVEADALAVHLNAAQEVFQPEGEPRYGGVLRRLSVLVEKLRVPIVIKETGSGISKEVAERLKAAGVKIIDVAGSGGTSWAKVEMYRARVKGDEVRAEAARTFSGWGVPTAISVLEVKSVYPEATVICSGGVRSGLDAAKCLALGADYAGMALPFLHAAAKGRDSLERLVDRVIFELRTAFFLTGAKDIETFKRKKPVLGLRLLAWSCQRGLGRRCEPACCQT